MAVWPARTVGTRRNRGFWTPCSRPGRASPPSPTATARRIWSTCCAVRRRSTSTAQRRLQRLTPTILAALGPVGLNRRNIRADSDVVPRVHAAFARRFQCRTASIVRKMPGSCPPRSRRSRHTSIVAACIAMGVAGLAFGATAAPRVALAADAAASTIPASRYKAPRNAKMSITDPPNKFEDIDHLQQLLRIRHRQIRPGREVAATSRRRPGASPSTASAR